LVDSLVSFVWFRCEISAYKLTHLHTFTCVSVTKQHDLVPATAAEILRVTQSGWCIPVIFSLTEIKQKTINNIFFLTETKTKTKIIEKKK